MRGKWPPDPARVRSILDGLEELYPDVDCELDPRDAVPAGLRDDPLRPVHRRPGQQGDARAVPPLPDARGHGPAPLPTLEKIIRSTGFFKQKAKSLKGTATGLLERFGGEVPRTLAELTTLPGVARKTANVVLGTAFGIAEGVVVDTHIQRLAMRLGLTRSTEPKGIEQDLMKVLPARELDPRRPPAHLARAPRLLRAQAELRRLHAGPVLPVGRAWKA